MSYFNRAIWDCNMPVIYILLRHGFKVDEREWGLHVNSIDYVCQLRLAGRLRSSADGRSLLGLILDYCNADMLNAFSVDGLALPCYVGWEQRILLSSQIGAGC